MDIVVLSGGVSAERDVSLKTGEMVTEALRGKGHRVILLDVFMGYGEKEEELAGIFERSREISARVEGISETVPDIAKVRASRVGPQDSFFGPNVIALCRMADIVFMALHGEDGENGKIQAAFDLFGIRYTGSGYFGSALAMNKGVAKQLFKENGIPTPEGITLKKEAAGKAALKKEAAGGAVPDKGGEAGAAARKPALPCVVKPCCGGSSIGVSIVRSEEELGAALAGAFCWEDELVIEEYVEGREFSVAVLDGKALPVIEIAPIEGFYDYKNKYKAGSTVETCPADIPAEDAEEMQRCAVRAAEVLGLDTYSRTDFLQDRDGKIYCLETNTLPGMTPTSLIPQEAAAAGMDFASLCEKLIEISLRKYEN